MHEYVQRAECQPILTKKKIENIDASLACQAHAAPHTHTHV